MNKTLRILILAFGASTVTAANVAAEAFPKPSAELCSIYRQGPVEHYRMPVYYGAPSEDPNSFYWIDVWFRPEYLFSPGTGNMSRPDGLPDRDQLFDINIADGQPLPYDYRRSARPQEDEFFTMLLRGGRQQEPIEKWLTLFANWHLYEREKFLAGEIPTFTKAGNSIAGLEELNVPSARKQVWEAQGQTLFAGFSDSGQIAAVMACDVDGTVPVPHCMLTEKSEFFEMSVSGFRRNQLDQLATVRQHAQNFTACLTWKGEE